MTAIEPSTSEAKCRASAASAWLEGRARGAVQRPGAPEIDRDVDHQHHERDRRDRRRRHAVAQAAPGGDQDAAGQHIEHRDDTERRQALDLAVAVMMLLVGRLVRHLHHHPGDHGGDQIDRRVQRLGDQREAADRDADHEFRGRHRGAGQDRNRGDTGFFGRSLAVHRGGLAADHVTSKDGLGYAIATHSQKRIVANCSDSIPCVFPVSVSSLRTQGPITPGVTGSESHLPSCRNERTRRMGPCVRRDDERSDDS